MLLQKLSEAQLKLKEMKPPYDTNVAEYVVSEFSQDLFTREQIENPNSFSEEELDAWLASGSNLWDEDVKYFGVGYDTIGLHIGDRQTLEQYWYVEITRNIKTYWDEDMSKFSVTLYYERKVADTLSKNFDFYSEFGSWNELIEKHFLSKVKNIAPSKIDTGFHLDFVGLR